MDLPGTLRFAELETAVYPFVFPKRTFFRHCSCGTGRVLVNRLHTSKLIVFWEIKIPWNSSQPMSTVIELFSLYWLQSGTYPAGGTGLK